MPVQIGKSPESDYTNPLGLLSDCHRRIEYFLNLLLTVAAQADKTGVGAEEREALQTALRYFREAAPKHTLDEEESLFPRLRALQNPQAEAACTMLARLHEDHQTAEAAHQEVERIFRQWLADDALPLDSRKRLTERLNELKQIYEAHIALEDHQIFPLARTLLEASEQQAIASEMASRRGINIEARRIEARRQVPDNSQVSTKNSVRRHDGLIPLSHDHHHALVLCLRIHRGLEESALDEGWLNAMAEDAVRFYESDLTPHFRAEEEVLFPALRPFSEATELVEELLGEHRTLETLIAQLQPMPLAGPAELLLQIADLLKAHIRKEENHLFPLCERLIAGPLSAHLGQEIRRLHK
jgi:hemerythrin-like domain-containing protein